MDRLDQRTFGRGLARAALLLALAAALPAKADDASPAVLAASCASCHGPGGASPGAIPPIDKLDSATMAAKLNGFRTGALEATVMNRIAKGYTDAEIATLVQFLTRPQR